METGSHEGRQFLAMFGGDVAQATIDDVAEFGEGYVVATVEDIACDELPETLNEVRVERIRGQELPSDAECLGEVHHEGAVLITSVVEYQCDGSLQPD